MRGDLCKVGEVGLHLVELQGAVDGVVAYLLAAECTEEGAGGEGEAEVAGKGADVGAFAAVDKEVGLRQVVGDGALGVVVEVGGLNFEF